jgi:hypothetical protein
MMTQFVAPARQATYRLAESLPWNQFLGFLKFISVSGTPPVLKFYRYPLSFVIILCHYHSILFVYFFIRGDSCVKKRRGLMSRSRLFNKTYNFVEVSAHNLKSSRT